MDRTSVLRTTTMLGLTSSTFLAGFYLASTQLFLPILYRFPSDIQTDVFQDLYYRGIPVVAPLGVSGGVFYAVSAYLNSKKRTGYAIAAVLSVAALPWTVLFMSKTINQLIAMSKDEQLRNSVGREQTIDLLKKWAWMNGVRSIFALAGGVTGLLLFAGEL